MKFLQLHHQNRDDTSKTAFISQTSIHPEDADHPADKSGDQVREWIKDTQKSFPLPDGCMWMVCTEDSEHFVKGKE